MDTMTSIGYYNPQLVPEPDSPLTITWAKAIVSGIKRLFDGGTKVGTLSSDSSPLIFITPNVTNYSKCPFVKIWTHAGSGAGRYYWDYFSQGKSEADSFWVNLEFRDKLGYAPANDVATVSFSPTILGAEGFTIIFHGR